MARSARDRLWKFIARVPKRWSLRDQATGRGRRAANDTQHAFGHDSSVRKAAGEIPNEATGCEARPPGQPTSRARANRPAGNTQIAELPGLRRTIEADRRHADPLCRRHSAGRAGSDRAHDPQRLVPELPETCRAEGARCFARRDVGQPRVGAFGLAALRLGQHALANRPGVQLPSATEDHARRFGADVVSIAGDALRLVRRNSTASPEIGRAARRRNAPGAWTAKPIGCGASQREI